MLILLIRLNEMIIMIIFVIKISKKLQLNDYNEMIMTECRALIESMAAQQRQV